MKALVFDLDDTLYVRSEPYISAYKKFFNNKYDIDGMELFLASRDVSEEEYRKRVAGIISMDEMNINRVKNTFLKYDIELSDNECLEFEKVYTDCQKKIQLMPYFKKLLDYAKSNEWFIGILSNGPVKRQHDKAEALGLSEWVPYDHILISEETGISKPDKKAFRLMESLMSSNIDEKWLIGDSYSYDVVGAKKSGWHCAWIQRIWTEIPASIEYKPDITSTNEEDIYNFIRLHL